MVNALSLVTAFVAIVPAAAIFFAAYGRYDGTFQDNVVFLYFIGGLVMGGLLGLITLYALAVTGVLIAVVLLALFYPIASVAGINRRKWQGERHAIFNGGAFGLGISVMLGFTIMYRYHTTLDALTVAQGVVLAAALSGLFFGMGLLAGDGVRRRRPFRVALTGTAILLAPVIFLEEYTHERAWLWLALLLAFGAVFAFAAERKLLIEGVSEEARRDRRRRKRAEQM